MRESEDAAVLECVRCGNHFSLRDIQSGLYRLETMVCSHCYQAMQQAPYSQFCFGKPMRIIAESGKREYGYNPEAPECRDLCPDREVCRQIILGR